MPRTPPCLVIGLLMIVASAVSAAMTATPAPSEAELRALWEGGTWRANIAHGGGWFSGFKSMKEYTDPDFVPPNMVPLKSPELERYKDIRRALGQGHSIFAPYAECHPAGMPYLLAMDGYGGAQAIVADDEILLIYGNHDYRRIYFRDHQHPKHKIEAEPVYNDDEPYQDAPTYNGDSIAHWEGATMVVDTVNIRGDHAQIEPHVPKPEGSHIVERYTPVAPGDMAVEMTMTNPRFTRPWVVSFHILRDSAGKLKENYCTDQNRWTMVPGEGLVMTGADGKPLEKAEP